MAAGSDQWAVFEADLRVGRLLHRNYFIASLSNFGLWAYGTDPKDAAENLERLLETFIQRCLKNGDLAERLEQAGVSLIPHPVAVLQGLNPTPVGGKEAPSVEPMIQWETPPNDHPAPSRWVAVPV